MAPRANAAGQLNGAGTTHQATAATSTVAKTTNPTDRKRMGRVLARTSVSDIRMAAA